MAITFFSTFHSLHVANGRRAEIQSKNVEGHSGYDEREAPSINAAQPAFCDLRYMLTNSIKRKDDLVAVLKYTGRAFMRSSQTEYNTILDEAKARTRGLSQGECEHVLCSHGYTYEQAKNGAYVYLHHGKNLITKRRGSASEYEEILDAFRAESKEPKECIAHLERRGFSYRQAQTAVYNYRRSRGLI